MRFSILIAAFLTGVAAPLAAQSTAKDSAAVVAVVDAFHAAMTAGNASGLMQLIAPDAVFLEAGGVETRAQYETSHLPADIEFEKSVSTKRSPIRVVVLGDAAWATSTSETVGNVSGSSHRLHGHRADGAQSRSRRLADQGHPLVVARPPQAGPVIGDGDRWYRVCGEGTALPRERRAAPSTDNAPGGGFSV